MNTPRTSSRMSQCVEEMNSPGVAEIRHPIREVCVSVGIYSTPEEVADACTRKKLEYESCSENLELQSKLNCCSGKKPGCVYKVKSGKWKGEIQKAKVKHKLGTYATPEDAREAISRKECELGWEDNAEQSEKDYDSKRWELGLQADAEQSQKNQRLRCVHQRKSGRWQTQIRHPVTKARIYLGTFDTAEEAKEAYDSKEREFGLLVRADKKKASCEAGATPEGKSDSTLPLGAFTEEAKDEAYGSKQSNYRLRSRKLGLKAEAEPSQKNQRLRNTYPKKSGRWTTEIRHPITKVKSHLGTFDTAEEAKEAYDRKRREFDLMFPNHKKRNQTKDSCDLKADPDQSEKIERPCCVEEAEEATSKRLKQSNDSYKGDAIGEGKSDSACVSDDPSVSTRVHLGMFMKDAEEPYNSTMCEFDNNKCEADDAVVVGKRDPACVSDEPSISTRVHSGTFTEEVDRAHDSKITDALLETFAKEAEDVYDREMREFDLMVLAQKAQNQCIGSCESDAIVEDKSDSNGSVINVVTQRTGDFDLGIVDSYGRLVGEYSRLDDELWIC